MWILRHSLRHIFRAPLKALLTAVVAMVFVLALGWLQETIYRNEIEIEHLYNTTHVTGVVRQANVGENITDRNLDDIIAHAAIEGLRESGLLYDYYILGATPFAYFFRTDINLDRGWVIWYDMDNLFSASRRGHETVFAPSSLEIFIRDNSRSAAHDVAGFEIILGGQPIAYMTVEFAEGRSTADFVYTAGRPIPVIMSQPSMEHYGLRGENHLALGEIAYVSHRFPTPLGQATPNEAVRVLVEIIATHNRHILAGEMYRDAIIMPADGLRSIMGDNVGYSDLLFTIDPIHNRNISYPQGVIQDIIQARGAGHTALAVYFNDSQLRNVVTPLENNLSLLRILQPVAIGIALIIGAGLALLMTLQQAKNAAIMRVLGTTSGRSGIMLWIELFLLCLIGLALGLGIVLLMENALPIFFAVMYMGAKTIGAVVGIVLVTNKAPLELLQVKE